MPTRGRSVQPHNPLTAETKTRRSSSRNASKPKSAPARPASRARAPKRAASPDTSPSPPPPSKRARAATRPPLSELKEVIPPRKAIRPIIPKPISRAKAAAAAFLPLPVFPDKGRPSPLIFAWGDGGSGQFGMGSDKTGTLSKPTRSKWVEEKTAEGLFGSGPGSGVVAIAAGGMHSLYVDENGTIWACGTNDDAALGLPSVDDMITIPQPLQSLIDARYHAVKIAAGDSVSASISTEGELRAWGSFRGIEGHLKFPNGSSHQSTPEVVLPGEPCVSLAAGNNHLLVLTSAGVIYSWGAGEQGQLGRKILERRKAHGTVPERVVLGARTRRATAVGAGAFHSFAVDERGGVWGWGLNAAGQTGTGADPADTDAVVQTPRRVRGLGAEELGADVRVVQIAGGDLHTVFLTSDGRVFACGRADSGQLGLPAGHPALADGAKSVALPVHVPFPESEAADPVVQVSAGTRFNAAVTRAGVLYVWGEGSVGELGAGDAEQLQTPTVVVRKEGPWAALHVSSGGQHSLGLLRRREP